MPEAIAAAGKLYSTLRGDIGLKRMRIFGKVHLVHLVLVWHV